MNLQTRYEKNQSHTVKSSSHIAEIEVHSRDSSMYASRKVGTVWAHGMFHKSGVWLSLTVNECPTGGRTRSTFITLYEPAARELYAMLHATYGAKP